MAALAKEVAPIRRQLPPFIEALVRDYLSQPPPQFPLERADLSNTDQALQYIFGQLRNQPLSALEAAAQAGKAFSFMPVGGGNFISRGAALGAGAANAPLLGPDQNLQALLNAGGAERFRQAMMNRAQGDVARLASAVAARGAATGFAGSSGTLGRRQQAVEQVMTQVQPQIEQAFLQELAGRRAAATDVFGQMARQDIARRQTAAQIANMLAQTGLGIRGQDIQRQLEGARIGLAGRGQDIVQEANRMRAALGAGQLGLDAGRFVFQENVAQRQAEIEDFMRRLQVLAELNRALQGPLTSDVPQQGGGGWQNAIGTILGMLAFGWAA